MLEPSSSEDENDTTTHPELDDTSSALSGHSSQRPDSGRQSQATNQSQNHLHPNQAVQRSVTPCVEPPTPVACNAQHQNYLTDKFLPARASLAHLRATSPNPPELIHEPDDDVEQVGEVEKAEREETERKTRLQLYVLVLRCVAYPFNAKQPIDLYKRPLKISLSQLEQINARFSSFLKGELSITADDAFINATHNYSDAFLKSNRLHMIVESGACSAFDFREVFRQNIEKRVKCLPEVEGTTKESIMSQWLTKFDAIFRGFDDGETKKLTGSKMQQYQQQQQNLQINDNVLTKEQLYDMFQNILKIKKFEHQLLFNALQVQYFLDF